jgi:hypothetical protein
MQRFDGGDRCFKWLGIEHKARRIIALREVWRDVWSAFPAGELLSCPYMRDFEMVLATNMIRIFREKNMSHRREKKVEAQLARGSAAFHRGDSLASVDAPVSMFR